MDIRRMIAAGVMGKNKVVVLDSFSDVDGTLIQNHVANKSPGAWGSSFSVYQGTKTIKITNNVASTLDGGSIGIVASVIDTGKANCVINADITTMNGAGGGNGLVFRYVDAQNFWYADAVTTPTNKLRIVEITSNVETVRYEVKLITTIALDTTYAMTVTLLGNTISFTALGKTISYSSSVRNTATKHGIMTVYTSGGKSSKVDNFLVRDTYIAPPQNETLFIPFGDSITYGVGASISSKKWSSLVAVSKGWVEFNAGISSTLTQNTVQNAIATIGGASSNNARDTYFARVGVYKPQYVCILYGINDIYLNDAAITETLFENDLGEIVDGLVAAGISASNIVIGSPSYTNNYTSSPWNVAPWNGGSAEKHQAYIAGCAAVATAKGTKYVDVYAWMVANGGDTLLGSDGLHPNDAGHQAIANAFLSVL